MSSRACYSSCEMGIEEGAVLRYDVVHDDVHAVLQLHV